MRFDYREVEGRCQELQAKVERLAAKPKQQAADREELASLLGEVHAREEIAGKMREAELEELRALVASGKSVELGGDYGFGADAVSRDYYKFLKTGKVMDVALSTTDANGGLIVPEPLHAEKIEKVRKSDPIFAGAFQFDLSGGDTVMTLPYKSAHGVAVVATETGARTEQTEPTFTAPTLTCYDYYTDQRATQTVIDSVPRMEELLLGWIYDDIYEAFGVHLATGSGAGQPSGLFAATSFYTTQLSGAAGALANTNPLSMFLALPPRYRASAVWLCNSATLAVLSGFASPSASQTSLVDWTSGAPRLLGKPVLECSSAPAIGAANYPLAVADLAAAFAVGTHRPPGVLRDPYTVAPYIRYYGLSRLGGCPFDPQACILLKSNSS